MVRLHAGSDPDTSENEDAGDSAKALTKKGTSRDNQQQQQHRHLDERTLADKDVANVERDAGLLKALSGIAAKAKEKIKTMTDPNTSAASAASAGASSSQAGGSSGSSQQRRGTSRELAIASGSKDYSEPKGRAGAQTDATATQKPAGQQQSEKRARSPPAKPAALLPTPSIPKLRNVPEPKKNASPSKRTHSRSRS